MKAQKRKRPMVLVTGFEPFLKHRINPTERLAREADGRVLGGVELAGRVLPTSFRRCEEVLDKAIRETDPEAVLMFGLAGSRKALSVEALALNVDHGEDPDNDGRRYWRRPIRRSGPAVLEATADVDALHAALKRARLPVGVSHHAGTYVCNHAFYCALLSRRRAAFIHVPKGMGIAKLRRALEALARTIARS